MSNKSSGEQVGVGPDTPGLTLVDYVTTLAPWVAYIAGTHLIGSWEYGFIIGSGVAAAIVLREIFTRQSRFMDLGTLLFCLVMTTFAVVDFNNSMNAYLKKYNLPLSLAFIGVLAITSLLIRSPFTYRCHKDHLPQDVINTPEVNTVIYSHHVEATTVWAVSEIAAGIISGILIVNHYGSYAIGAQLVGTLIPIGFTSLTHQKIHVHPIVSSHPSMASASK